MLLKPSLLSVNKILASLLLLVLRRDFCTRSLPISSVHIFIGIQHLKSLLYFGERGEPKTMIDVSIEAVTNQIDFLPIRTVLLVPEKSNGYH